jgi:hypothetical protein
MPLWQEVADALELHELATVTVWAARTGDLDWAPTLSQPSENVVLYMLSDGDLVRAEEVAFGDPLPYVAVLSPVPGSLANITAAFADTAYRYYRTDAVYRQDDDQPIPTIYFLHWAERIDTANAPQHLMPLEAAAGMMDGSLVFALQVSAAETTLREFPAASFALAFGTQFGVDESEALAVPAAMPMAVPMPTAMPMTMTAPTPAGAAPWLGPAVLGLAAALGVYVVMTSGRSR